jgi:hypothetical protein
MNTYIKKSKLKEPKEQVYIEFLNKNKNFKKDKKYFDTYDKAENWGKNELDNFHPDMIYNQSNQCD